MRKFAFFAVMFAMAASCTVKEIDNGPEVTPIISTGSGKTVKAPDITAAFSDKNTKSTITTDDDGVGTVWWTPADEINVFYDKTSTHYTSQNTENTTSAVFCTDDEISEGDLAKTNIWGLYPYDKDAVCDGSSVTTTIPATQKAIAGSFDEELFTSLAHSTGTDMKFYNVLGGIKFSLSRDDIRSVTFKGNNGEEIAGKVSLSMGDEGAPVSSVAEGEGMKAITLVPKEEGACFESNTNYYIVMLPVELSEGFTMSFETATDVLVLDSRSSVQIKRSVFKRAADIDKRATAMSPLTLSGNAFAVSLNQEGNPDTISLEYRFGNGDWKPYVIGTKLPADSDNPGYGGMTLQFRAREGSNKNFSKDAQNYYYFKSNDEISLSGNIMSLLDGTMQDNTLYDYAFYKLFDTNPRITDASGLELPATVLAPYCYASMFSMCLALTSAPGLPATTLAAGCYKFMFQNCVNLESSPELPATTLAMSCYEGMFSNCGKMSPAPELPATTLEESCYSIMFNNCEALSAAPKLPATTLAKWCYFSMFSGCSGLTKAPELPVTTLADGCYEGMFSYCDYLESAPALPATVLTDACYKDMFSNCLRLAEAPTLPAEVMAKSCYSGMFSRCTGLKSAPELPLTTLAEHCYDSMFKGCTALTKAPELPATEMEEYCYRAMFSGCTALTDAPYLPAETLADACYSNMFDGCEALEVIRVEFTDWKKHETTGYPATEYWMMNVASTGKFYCPPALDVSTRGRDYVPEGWEILCNPLKSITLEPAEFTILVGETSAAPSVIYDPAYVVNRELIWSSSNNSVASVDAEGRVTGLAEGTATITATSVEGAKTSTSTVTVVGVGPADLAGTFSVSADKTVHFSQGNLYWNGSKWRFESNQYDFPRAWDPYHVGHLAWVNDEAEAVSGAWNEDWYSDCTSLFTNDPAQPGSPNPDFRIYEAKGKYRTLTSTEWDYLLNERKVNGYAGEGYSYKYVFDKTVCSVKVCGIFIFPDGFTGQNNMETDYSTWEAINAAGIVYLPAAGYREGSKIETPVIQSHGYYWTSSFDRQSKTATYAKYLKFDANQDVTDIAAAQLSIDDVETSEAHSIRLVTDSEPAIGTISIYNGIVGMYVGTTTDGKKLIVSTKNYGSASTTGKGTAYTREELKSLAIPDGWQLPTEQDMAVLANLGFEKDSTNDGAYSSRYDFFIPYTQNVSGNMREGRIWVVGGSDNDFFWVRSDNAYGMTYTQTENMNYYVRLIRKL